MATQTSIQALIRHADPDFDKDRRKDLAYDFGGRKRFYTDGNSGAAGYESDPPESEE